MVVPIYKGHKLPPSYPQDKGGHFGLWYDRAFQYKDNWATDDDTKRRWIQGICRATAGSNSLASFAARRMALVRSLGGEARVFTTSWHFTTGLGNPHPVENGFSWHHTLGTPYLTGSAVKGLLRHWVRFGDGEEDASRLREWFGDVDRAGSLLFFDAVPIKPVKLVCDVMTPHMGEWYEKGDMIRTPDDNPKAVPADWHDPVPVPFLVVKEASLLFGIAPQRRGGKSAAMVKEALDALEQALTWLGAGAKTAVGYGRMTPSVAETEKLEKILQQQQEARQQEAEKQRVLAGVSDLDEKVAARLGEKIQSYGELIAVLKSDDFTAAERREYALRLKKMMQEAKVWDNPKKPKDVERKKLVEEWLSEQGS